MLKMSDHARDRIQDSLKESSASGLSYFRVSLEKKDCTGEHFEFSLDQKRSGDQIIEVEGIGVLLDPLAMQYVHGKTLDYVEEAKQHGFILS